MVESALVRVLCLFLERMACRTRDVHHIALASSPWSSLPFAGAEHTQATAATMKGVGIPPRIMVDCSHGNSQKQHKNQLVACASVAQQVATGFVPPSSLLPSSASPLFSLLLLLLCFCLFVSCCFFLYFFASRSITCPAGRS